MSLVCIYQLFTYFMTFFSYSKVEGLLPQNGSRKKPSPQLLDFDYLLVSSGDVELFHDTHDVLLSQEGFSRLSLDLSTFPPIKVDMRNAIFILAKRRNADHSAN